MKRTPTVEWQTNGVCNYDCTYCIQSKKFRTGQPEPEQIEAFLRFFHRLPGTWEIKMSGGEPFASRAFMTRIIPGLMETRHNVSVLTNLSAPIGVLERFAELTRGRLKVVSASLHLEYVEPGAFVGKARAFVERLEPTSSFVVNSVVVPGTVARLLEVRREVEAAGLKFFPQLMKTKHGLAEYSAEERGLVEQLVGRNPSSWDANLSPSYKGRLCWTGVDYFVLSQQGDAYSCRTAKRFGEGYLGNVFDDSIQLRLEPGRCAYDICPCTVPMHRGMIEGQEAEDGAVDRLEAGEADFGSLHAAHPGPRSSGPTEHEARPGRENGRESGRENGREDGWLRSLVSRLGARP